MPKAKSKRQARLFGAIAGGRKTKATGMSRKEARNRLRGVNIKKLPNRARKRKRSGTKRKRR
jgi:hypothetical protein